MWSRVAAVSITIGALAVPAIAPAHAAGSTFTVTSSQCTGPGSFVDAIQQANNTPGRDTVTFAPGLTVDLGTCPLGEPYKAAVATESVDIVGNGVVFNGYQTWVTSSGNLTPLDQCPRTSAGSVVTALAPGLISAGEYNQDNAGVEVTISDLSLKNVSTMLAAQKNSSVRVSNVFAQGINDFHGSCLRQPIEVFAGADLSLDRVTITETTLPGKVDPVFGSPLSGVIGNNGTGGGGKLTVQNSLLAYNFSGAAIDWDGDADIVSSRFINSGGVFVSGGTGRIVNSALLMEGNSDAVDRIAARAGATVDFSASTANWEYPSCTKPTQCGPSGMGLWADGGTFVLSGSAVGGGDYPDTGPLLRATNGGTFTSDDKTWVQPTGQQDATAINAVLPQALTQLPGLNPVPLVVRWPASVTPLLGTPSSPGVLLDAITDAAPGGSNSLLNPIDGQPISLDALGNPRWDPGNETRNIGAVQTVQSPHLSLETPWSWGSGEVMLSWNRPLDPPSGAITGYAVFYTPVGGGPEQRIDIPGADSLSTAVTGLTNGTEYEFAVAGVNASGDGPRSNTVAATPFGTLEAPVVSAEPGNHSATLFWTEPDTGGHPTPLAYGVSYRPKGTNAWSEGPSFIAARFTRIDGLVNGTEYEFAVYATAADGTQGLVGNATVTPTAGAGASVFVPIDPQRVYDSRLAGPGGTPDPITAFEQRIISVANGTDYNTGQVTIPDLVPAGATSIAFNLTATGTTGPGLFAITPGDATTIDTSTVNWPQANDVIANGLTVKIDANRTVKVYNQSGYQADAVLDVVGYFVDPGQPGAVFHEINPTRVYDSRDLNSPIAGFSDRVIQVANAWYPMPDPVVPAGATAIAYNITATGTQGSSLFAVTPGDASTYNSSTINWPGANSTIANGQFVSLDSNRQIKVFNGGSTAADVVIDVLGYFTDAAGSTSGTYFHSIDPVRAYDSRMPQPDQGAIGSDQIRTVSVADGRDQNTGAVTVPNAIPSDASSISYNLTATSTMASGFFLVTPGDVFASPPTSSINWPRSNFVIANGLTVALDAQRQINVRNRSDGSTEVVVDLYGYFK